MDENVIKQLSEVYGKKKAKKLVKQIKALKKKHPKIVFSFIFDEEGNLQAVPKDIHDEPQKKLQPS